MTVGGFPDDAVDRFDGIGRINDPPYFSLIAEHGRNPDPVPAPHPGYPWILTPVLPELLKVRQCFPFIDRLILCDHTHKNIK